jgi:hypothetical protein
MAITNAQQYQQLVNKPANGKRPGYRGPGGYQGSTGGSKADDRSSAQQTSNNNAQTGGGGRQDGNQEDSRIFYGPKGETIDIGFQGDLNNREQEFQNFLDKRNKVNLFGLSKIFTKPVQEFSNFNASVNRPFFGDVIRAGKIPGLSFDMTEEEYEDAYQNYMSSRLGGEIDAYGNPLNQGDGSDPVIPLMAQAPSNTDQETEVEEEPFQRNFRLMADGGRAEFAEGGMPYEGGIMDLESSRQMYGLGKLVKKITRGVKKLAKSPIGKAALLYAGGSYLSGMGAFGGLKGAGAFNSQALGLKNFLMGSALPPSKGLGKSKGLLDFIGGKAGAGILGTTALSYFMTPEEEEEQKLASYGADIDDPRTIMANPSLYTNRRLAAEGGSMDEPVAKKTMPLLDMDGQEMDLRAEGGFVPIGRMEKADDVPARLSKNEFVFTADAVRNAGEGDVDKGAEVMYNMMKNLESGGDVSEESQGLEGAREMFQTSQRLEEVL